MAILNKGQTFSDGEQVTSAKLNTAVDGATFAPGAVDDVSTQLSGGAIIVKDGGVGTAKITDNAVTSAKILDSNVTKGKIEDVANMKVLGNTSGSSTAPQEVSILDEDDMVSDSNTSIPTQQSVKAYVDDNGITQSTGSAPYYGVRAWARYNGQTNTLEASGNISSVTRNSTGYYTFNFDTPMPSANYAVSLAYSGEVSLQHTVGFVGGITSNGFQAQIYNAANSGYVVNKSIVCVIVIA
jgi:hypothetical protein